MVGIILGATFALPNKLQDPVFNVCFVSMIVLLAATMLGSGLVALWLPFYIVYRKKSAATTPSSSGQPNGPH
jgi:thiol:disulfide interchange protein